MYPDIVDKHKVGVTGGSHGGFLVGWLMGHQEYKHIFKAAVARNPVFDMNYMLDSTEIPDWIYACVAKS